ncbi:MAG: CRISPR-associated endonuclease Cas1 [Saprospiraceae bacterium]|nr:CRISPR-associated endonuclease Cas1 [Saprospiraceae bacterium]
MKTQEIIIKTKGVTIDYRAPYLICTIGEEIKKINGGAISSIKMLEHCVMTSQVFDLIHKNGITITIQNGHSHPICKCVPFFQKLDKDAYRAQIKYSEGEAGVLKKIAIRWLDEKFKGRFQLMEQKLPEQKRTELEALKKTWYEESAEAHLESQSNLLSKEALSSKQYWKLFNFCLPHAFRFKVRTKNPGEDLTNVLLNYGYGILYGVIEKCITSCGLDPYCGIFHVDGSGRKSLVYDMIEAFRSSVEQMVIEFLWDKEIDLKMFEFESHILPAEIKGMYVEKWREFNKEKHVTTGIMNFVENFKKELEQIQDN